MATETTVNGVPRAALSPLDVLTLAQAAEYLQLSEDAVRGEAEAGRLVGRNVRGEWRFVRESIVAWLRRADEASGPTDVGAELAEHIRRVNRQSTFHETDAEVETFIADVYEVRKATPAGGKR